MKQKLRDFYYSVSPSWRLKLRRLYYLPLDLYEKWTGKRSELSPPKGMIFTGSGDFVKQGELFLNHFIQLGELKPEHHVLDVGSGIGRMAIPLTGYLNHQAKYEGFDIMPQGVNWCKNHISKKYPNFNFTRVELSNSLYANHGKKADNFIFPYDDNLFDFVFLTSVFTHMMPADVQHYLKEIDRVLKPGGKCFSTFFIVDKEAQSYMSKQDVPFLPHAFNEYYLHNMKVPEANIGFTHSFIEKITEKLKTSQTAFYPGWWSGRPKNQSTDFQDILIFTKALSI